MAETFEELADAADEILSAALLILGATAPARSFVSNGEPAYDCPQMTVHLSSFAVQPTATSGGTGTTTHPRALLYQAIYRLEIVRCSPQPDAQGRILPAALAQHARNAYVDLYALFPQLRRMISRGQILAAAWCRGVSMGTATPVDDSGGVSGWRMDISVEMGGPDGNS